MEKQFKVGDVVRLKSGGPKMTVVENPDIYFGSDVLKVKCQWFDGSKLSEDTFSVGGLTKSEDIIVEPV